MKKRLYPIFLKLEDVPCCVIGGGTVALRKVKSLLESKAVLSVVSPELCPGLVILKNKKCIVHEKSKYEKKFLKGKFLVIAATNDGAVNKKIAADARKMNLLVNVVDVPKECSFYVPSVLCAQGISMAISTQGAFPGISRRLRKECSPVFQKYAKSLKILAGLRRDIYRSDASQTQKKMLAKSLICPDVLERIDSKTIGDIKSLKTYLKAR